MKFDLIKRLTPVRVKSFIKIWEKRKFFSNLINEIENYKNEYDLLIGTPIHINLGDHLITMAEQQILKDVNPDRKVYEIPSEVYNIYKYRLKRIVPESTRIFINGGGWMGNLWPVEERLMQNIISSFCDNKIVIFPQTIFYDNTIKSYKSLLRRSNKAYCKCRNLTLFVRDKKSYDFAINNLSIDKVFLAPDIALYYSFDKYESAREDVIGICLRDDREKLITDNSINQIRKIAGDKNIKLKTVSTLYETRVFPDQRKEICEKRLSEFSKCRMIITDRLHAMIFSVLTNTPCIVFDNKTKKVSGVYNLWLSDNEMVYPVFETIDYHLIAFLMSRCNRIQKPKLNYFDEFLLVMKEIQYGGD